MEVHELCNLFPEMSPDEFSELAGDINRNGLIEPIWTHEDKIIDGRHRYRVCMIYGLTPIYREWNGEGGSLLRFVLARNLHRRNLTPGQKAALAAEIKPMIEAQIREELREKQREAARETNRKRNGGNGTVFANNSKDRPPRDSTAEAAKTTGASRAYVSDAERIRDASPKAFDEIKAGKKSIPQAKRELFPKPDPEPGPPPEPAPPSIAEPDPDPVPTWPQSPPSDEDEVAAVLRHYFDVAALIAALKRHL